VGLGSDTLPDVGRCPPLSRGKLAGIIQTNFCGKGEVQGLRGSLSSGQAFHKQNVDPFS